MHEISSHGCSFLGRLYLEIEKQGLSGAERRDDLQAAARQRARRGGSGRRPLPLIAIGANVRIKMFLSHDRFPFPFSPVQMSGDDCRPRSRGRGDGRQVTFEAEKEK
jgi:hypothetical protein